MRAHNSPRLAQPPRRPLCKRGIEGDFGMDAVLRVAKSPLPPFFKGGKSEPKEVGS